MVHWKVPQKLQKLPGLMAQTWADFLAIIEIRNNKSVVERVLKKHTQVEVPLPSKKRSASRVKILVQKTT